MVTSSKPLQTSAPMLYLIVKGSPDAALFAAWVRGVPAEVVQGSRSGETMLRVDHRYKLAAYEWATEPGAVPYKVGACVGLYRGAA